MMLYFSPQFFTCFFIGLHRICSYVWLVKLKRKQHFPYWKTHSFQYSRTLEIALQGFEISKFSGGVCHQTPCCSPIKRKGTNGLLFIQSVAALFKPAGYFNGRFQKISMLHHGRLLGFPKGTEGSRLWNSEGMGGIYDLKSEGMGEFHRWDFWNRKCRVSSLKTLLCGLL